MIQVPDVLEGVCNYLSKTNDTMRVRVVALAHLRVEYSPLTQLNP